MIVKKFQGETEKDAILKAQEELGNNAVVLNVKTIKQRGILKLFKKDVVEVTAALEEEELSKKANTGAKEFGKAFEASSYAGNMHKQPDISSRPAGGLNLLADEKISVSSESAVIEQKLDSLHSLLQSQINAGASRKNSMQVDDEKERDDIAAERIAGKKAVEERENANMKFIRLIYKKLVDNEVNEKFTLKFGYTQELIQDKSETSVFLKGPLGIFFGTFQGIYDIRKVTESYESMRMMEQLMQSYREHYGL